jgi:hypothetical protein
VPLAQGNVGELVTLQIDLTAKGSTLVSIPLDLESMDVGQWLVGTGLSPKGIHGWDAQTQRYVPLRTIRPGEGFLLARGPGKVSIQGKRIVSDTVELTLNKGWNLLGVPYESGIPLAALRVTLDGKTESYAQAVENKWIGGVSSLMDGASVPISADDNPKLEPWRGYWLYAFQPCLLSMPSSWFLEKVKAGKPKRSH